MLLLIDDDFFKDLEKLLAENNKLGAKVWDLINDIRKHPETGLGKPEELRHNMSGWWSRRITEKHRLVYRITKHLETECLEVVSCYLHYGDK